MGHFDGIEDSKASEGGIYVSPGVYALEILALKAGKDRGGIPFFVAECRTLESSNPERPVGGTQSWMVKVKGANRETHLGNIKKFLSVLAGIPPEKIDSAGVDGAVSAANPFAGSKIRCTATNIMVGTAKTQPFTKCDWRPF